MDKIASTFQKAANSKVPISALRRKSILKMKKLEVELGFEDHSPTVKDHHEDCGYIELPD